MRNVPHWSEQRLIILLSLAATLVWVGMVGRDLSWDVLNHHVYLPFSWLSGRYAIDLFAAGPQSYQNPLGYSIFYLMLKNQWPSWVIGFTLTALHATAAWPLYRIVVTIWGEMREDRFWRLTAFTMAWITPAFLLFVGTSSIDPITNLLVLIALAQVLASSRGRMPPITAGALIGLALALKPTSLPFAVAIGVLWCMRSAAGSISWSAVAYYSLAVCAAVALFQGPWSWWLWKNFQNPLYPLFNNLFQSPWGPSSSIVAMRFLPSTVLDYLSRPLEMAKFSAFSSLEQFAPDIRPALAVLLGMACLVTRARNFSTHALRGYADTPVIQLTVFALVAYVLWMKSTGNARYAIPLLMVVGILAVAAIQRLLSRSWARILVLFALAIQFSYYAHDGEHRLHAADWDASPYLDVAVPPRLAGTPYLHASIGALSYAGVSTALHPDGAMLNLVGQMSLPVDGPLGRAVGERLTRWKENTRLLFPGKLNFDDETVRRKLSANIDSLVYRFGLQVDLNDCEAITIRRPRSGPPADLSLLSCAASATTLAVDNFRSELERADKIFTMLEAQCPHILSPSPLATEGNVSNWQRYYMNTDARLTISAVDGVLLSHFRSLRIERLGSVDDVEAGRGTPACQAWDDMFKR